MAVATIIARPWGRRVMRTAIARLGAIEPIPKWIDAEDLMPMGTGAYTTVREPHPGHSITTYEPREVLDIRGLIPDSVILAGMTECVLTRSAALTLAGKPEAFHRAESTVLVGADLAKETGVAGNLG